MYFLRIVTLSVVYLQYNNPDIITVKIKPDTKGSLE